MPGFLMSNIKMSDIVEVYAKGEQIEVVCVKEEQVEPNFQDVETESELKKYDKYSKEFSHNIERINQLDVHKNNSPYQCKNCEKTFSRECDLKNHIRTHTDEKPFECIQCYKVFAQSRSLKRHMKIHTGEKPYMCSYCFKAFSEMGDLTRHMRTHTGEKPLHKKENPYPYQCSKCDRTFSTSWVMKSHMRSQHVEKPYQCSHCNKSFSTNSLLISHLKLHIIGKSYKCSSCDKTFAIVNCINDQETDTINDSYKCNTCVDSFVNEKFLVNHHKDVENLPSVINAEDRNTQYSEVVEKTAKTQCISCKNEFKNIYIHVFKSSLCKKSYDIDLLKRQAKEAEREKSRRKVFVYRQRQMAKDIEGFRAKQKSYKAASRKRQSDKNSSELTVKTETIENTTEDIVTGNM